MRTTTTSTVLGAGLLLLGVITPLMVNADPIQSPPTSSDAQHDFDFEFGIWHTHLRRLTHPLSNSSIWAEYEGQTTVRKVWDGRSNLVELEVDGPQGHIEALSLRLYDPNTHQWSLNFASSAGGGIATASIGGFHQNSGEFSDQELIGGRTVLVRFVITRVSRTIVHFEQAYSEDGGKKWEVNWIADDTLIPDDRPTS